MAYQECVCLGSGGNTAWTSCQPLFGDANGFAFSRNVAKDGVRKSYDITSAATLGTSFIDDFYNTDGTKRLFPVSGLVSTSLVTADTVYDDGSDGQGDFSRNGIISFSGEKRQAGAVYADKINSHRCKDNGAFVATDKGVYGVRRIDTATNTASWHPVPIRKLEGKWMPKDLANNTVEKVMVSYDFDLRLNVGELWLMTWAELGITEDDFIYAGIQDVNFALVTAPAASLGTTQVEYSLSTDYGQGFVGQNVNGKVEADFSVLNQDTGLQVAGLSITEVSGVKYTLEYTQETPGETIVVSMATSETNRFEGSATAYAEPV